MEFYDKLMNYYSYNYDVTNDYQLGSRNFDGYCHLDIQNSKYVLVKKAKLWQANCYEHVFIRKVDEINRDIVKEDLKFIKEYVEPTLVSKGKYPDSNHMYSYITWIYINSNGTITNVLKDIKKSQFYKNYLFSLRGYCQLRMLAIDLKYQQVIGNPAAKSLVKEIRKVL